MKTRPEEPLSICFKKTTLWGVADAWSTAVMVEGAETADDGGGVDPQDTCDLLFIGIERQWFVNKTLKFHCCSDRPMKPFRKSSGRTFCEIQTSFLQYGHLVEASSNSFRMALGDVAMHLASHPAIAQNRVLQESVGLELLEYLSSVAVEQLVHFWHWVQLHSDRIHPGEEKQR